MSRRREKKRLLCKTGIVCAVILGVGLGSFFVERISAETAVKQAQTSKAEVTEKQIPSLTATDGTGSTRNPDEPEYYDGLGYDVIYRDKAELVGDDEKEAVLASMEPISEYANVIFYTTDEYEASDTATVCEKICEGYYGSSKKAPVVMFAIDMYNREIYLYCTGPTRHIIRTPLRIISTAWPVPDATMTAPSEPSSSVSVFSPAAVSGGPCSVSTTCSWRLSWAF